MEYPTQAKNGNGNGAAEAMKATGDGKECPASTEDTNSSVASLNSSAEAEEQAKNDGSADTLQSFIDDDDAEEDNEKEKAAEDRTASNGEEAEMATEATISIAALGASSEDGLSSQDEGATSQEEEDDEEVILDGNGSAAGVGTAVTVIGILGNRRDSVLIKPKITKEGVGSAADEAGAGPAREDVEMPMPDEVDGEDEEDEEEEEEEDEDPLVAGAAAAKANGDVDKWVKYLDETDPCHRLRSLCKKGDVAGLTQLLEAKNPDVDINSVSEEGWTSLHEIITHECQFTEVAKVLLRFGASVNTQDLHGDSPLHSALLYHNLENISLLLEHEADQDLLNAGGRMPVHVADEVDTLRLLLDAKADVVNAQDRVGNTPLHYAIAARDRQRIALLIEYKPDVNLANRAGSTPLHLVTDTELAGMLMSAAANPNQPDVNANTPLHLAVRARRKEIVRLMLEQKADASLVNASGKTPLNLAKDREMKNILLGKPTATDSKKSKKLMNTSVSSPSGSSSPAPPEPSAISEKLSSSIVIPECSSPSILKRKRDPEEDNEDEDGSCKRRKGPRLRFSEVNDYSGVEVVEEEEKRTARSAAPMYYEQAFTSSDEND